MNPHEPGSWRDGCAAGIWYALTAPLWSGGRRLGSLTRSVGSGVAPFLEGPSGESDSGGGAAATGGPGVEATVGSVLDPDGPKHPSGEEGLFGDEGPVSLRAGWRSLAILGRIPFGPWRNACLQRSVVACRSLRAAGQDAVVRIGVRRGVRATGRGVEAHAWVEVVGGQPGHGSGPEDRRVSGYLPLRRSAGVG